MTRRDDPLIATYCTTAFGPVRVPNYSLIDQHWAKINVWAEHAYKRGLRLKEIKRYEA